MRVASKRRDARFLRLPTICKRGGAEQLVRRDYPAATRGEVEASARLWADCARCRFERSRQDVAHRMSTCHPGEFPRWARAHRRLTAWIARLS